MRHIKFLVVYDYLPTKQSKYSWKQLIVLEQKKKYKLGGIGESLALQAVMSKTISQILMTDQWTS